MKLSGLGLLLEGFGLLLAGLAARLLRHPPQLGDILRPAVRAVFLVAEIALAGAAAAQADQRAESNPAALARSAASAAAFLKASAIAFWRSCFESTATNRNVGCPSGGGCSP